MPGPQGAGRCSSPDQALLLERCMPLGPWSQGARRFSPSDEN
ncbi:hypothetical protein C4K14_3411 [Pseudomonas chlororaphis subsp. aureofaciens]|nr:hypothetical protein C4K14_3411 [Pseudomonas chlororaphis subsp. aureofaciens]